MSLPQKGSRQKYTKVSCRGIGFAEMGKLKDHLKAVHHLPSNTHKHALNFKSKTFTALKSIEQKWKLVFQILFPDVPIDQVPSAYSNEYAVEEAKPVSPLTAGGNLDTLRDCFRSILLDRYGIEILCEIPELEVEFDGIFNEAVQAWRNGTHVNTLGNVGYAVQDSTAFVEEMGRFSIQEQQLDDVLGPSMVTDVIQSTGCDGDAPDVNSLLMNMDVAPEEPDMAKVDEEIMFPGGFDFDFSNQLNYTLPDYFDTNCPPALNFETAWNLDSPAVAIDYSDDSGPFMGNFAPSEEDITCFSDSMLTGMLPSYEKNVETSQEDSDMEEWCNMAACTPYDEWTEDKMTEMELLVDRMF